MDEEQKHGGYYEPFDPDEFMHLLDGADMSNERKREFINTMWLITSEFADLGFGVHPVQVAQAARENRKPTEREIWREAIANFMAETDEEAKT